MRSIAYDANRLPTRVDYGDPAVVNELYTEMTYDQRLRPTRALAVRTPTAGAVSPDLNAVTTVHDFNYTWDAVSNLTSVSDARATAEWPAGYRPWSQVVQHDALYRVTRIDYAYAGGSGLTGEDDDATDWRQERTRTNADGSTHEGRDPMHRRPAPMVSDNAATRVRWLEYDYDWLANQSTWNDDQGVFYERSAGRLTSGSDDPNFSPFNPALRPSALYLSTNISNAPATYQPGVDRGGYVWLDYGQSGNVTRMTVRSQCVDVSASSLCADTAGSLSTRHNRLKARCSCAEEQHYRYDWDELNRLYEARRYDRHGGTGDWDLMVQQRYRYDAGNVRMVKETVNFGNDGASFAATTLHPYPGDYERRGLELDTVANTYNASTALGTETQYMVGGARLVWARNDPGSESLTRDQRLTLSLSDLVQSTAAVVDLQSGELLEHTTFYPNGARETHRTTDDVSLQLEPIGFTGKEADEEVGLVYFGERYLIPRLGRWASVDPLSVHAVGGGEALNGYHYVSGNLLQARDPLGLQAGSVTVTGATRGRSTIRHREAQREGNALNQMVQVLKQFFALANQSTVAGRLNNGVARARYIMQAQAQVAGLMERLRAGELPSDLVDDAIRLRNEALALSRSRVTPEALQISRWLKEEGLTIEGLRAERARDMFRTTYDALDDTGREAVDRRIVERSGVTRRWVNGAAGAMTLLAAASLAYDIYEVNQLPVDERGRAATRLAGRTVVGAGGAYAGGAIAVAVCADTAGAGCVVLGLVLTAGGGIGGAAIGDEGMDRLYSQIYGESAGRPAARERTSGGENPVDDSAADEE